MFQNIRADALRYHRRNKTLHRGDYLRLIRAHFGLQALVVYRFGRWLLGYPAGRLVTWLLSPVYWLLATYIHRAYGIRLERNADIGPGLYIGHFGNIFVARCRIGSHCSIQQHVTLGPQLPGSGPEIGDRVWIGAHAEITGNVRIGDGATIGAGTVLNQDIPPQCLVLGNPGRAIQRNYDNSAFI